MVSERNLSNSYILTIHGKKISSIKEVKLLRVSIDNRLTFKKNIDKHIVEHHTNFTPCSE